jgi:HK97 family phage prohead protease
MLHGASTGKLEVRRGSDGATRLIGTFPYNLIAVLSDGGRTGRPQKETILSRAFSYRVDDPAEDIFLLVGHDFGEPLASKATGTLKLRDAADALTFEAIISRSIADTSYAKDILAAIGAGLAVGLSPGFRIPPKRAVPNAEEVVQEPTDPAAGNHGAIIRKIREALLYELSIVTTAAYKEAQVEMRSWDITTRAFGKRTPAFMWRA